MRPWSLVFLLCVLSVSCSANDADPDAFGILSPRLLSAGLQTGPLEQTADEDRRLDLGEIRLRGAAEWSTHARAYPTFGYTDAAHWFRLRVRNPGEPVEVVLRVAFEHIDHIEIHVHQQDEEYFQSYGGRDYPFSIKEISHRRYAFQFRLRAGESTIYLMARSGHTLNVPIELYSTSEYQAAWVGEQNRMVFYFGTFAFLFLLNCLFYYIFRDDHFLYYLLYVFASGLFQFSLNGYGFQFLWPNAVYWNLISPTVLSCLWGITIVIFCKRFLGTALHIRVTNMILNLSIVAFVLNILALSIFPYSKTEWVVNNIFTPGIMALCISAGIQVLWKGNRAARFYLVGWSFFSLLLLMYTQQNLGFVPNGFYFGVDMYEFFMLGNLAEMLFFPVAIADRIRTIVREHTERGEPVSPLASTRPSRLTRLDLSAVRERLYDLMDERQVYRKNITLGKLARFAGISEKDLSEFLNEEERKSFYQFVNEFRIKEACRLLLESPDLKILEIAHDVGFQSLSTFNSAFQKQQGMSPRAFRKAGGVTG